jgi:hypothetical protein
MQISLADLKKAAFMQSCLSKQTTRCQWVVIYHNKDNEDNDEEHVALLSYLIVNTEQRR